MAAWSLTGWVTLTVAAATGAGNTFDGSDKLPEPIPTRQEYFLIPFQVDEGRNSPMLSQVELWASGDRGRTWKHYYTVDPQTRQFPFRAGGDGEFWFAIRTIDAQGQARPEQVREPGLRVVVDTTSPELMFEADRDASGQIRARWKIEEKNLADDGLVIQYRAGPTDSWQDVPIRRAGSGSIPAQSETAWWAPRGARQLEIRAEVVDTAGNRDLRHAQLTLTDEAAEQGIVDPFQAARTTPPAMRPNGSYSPSPQPEPFQPEPQGPESSATATYSTPEATRADTRTVSRYGQQQASNPYSYADASRKPRDRQSDRSTRGHSEDSWAASDSSSETDFSDRSSATSYDANRGQSSGYGESSYGESSYGESSYGESSYGESSHGESGYGEVASSSPYASADRYRSDSSWQDSSTHSSERDPYSSPSSYRSDESRSSYAGNTTRSAYASDTSSSAYASDTSNSTYASDMSSSAYASDSEDRGSDASSDWYSVEPDNDDARSRRYGQADRDRSERSEATGVSADRSTDSWRSEEETWRSDERSSKGRGRGKRRVRIVSVEPSTGRNANRMIIRWETEGPPLASNTVKLFYATSRFGPWETIADNLMSTAGKYSWQPDESLRGYVYVRIEVPEPTGGVLEAETPTPVRLPDPVSSRRESTAPQAPSSESPWADQGESYAWP